MLKKFSITDLILATNNIFSSKSKKKTYVRGLISKKIINTKIQQDKIEQPKLKKVIAEKKLLLKNKNNYTPQVTPDFTIKLKDDVKSTMVDELYNLFKKKVKKNTLKIIIDHQLEAKSSKNKINFLTINIKNLESYYKNLQISYDSILKERELLESDNNTLRVKFKVVTQDNASLESDNLSIQKNLDIQIRNYEILTKNNLKLKQNIEKINKDRSLLEVDINELNSKLNEIVDVNNILQLTSKDMKVMLVKSTQNNKLLLNNSKDLHANLHRIVKNNRLLESKNKELLEKIEYIESIKLEDKFNVQSYNELIEKNKLLTSQINNFKNYKTDITSNNHSEVALNKLKFYQDENVRLSSELVSTQNRHDILKNNITKIEIDKNNISSQIQELNNSLNNTNIVKTPFTKEIPQEAVNDLNKMNSNDKKDLDDIINKIFNKL